MLHGFVISGSADPRRELVVPATSQSTSQAKDIAT